MAHEATKAMRRRQREEKEGGFAWSKIFVGKGIDVGAGPDCLSGCQPFDLEHGNAEKLSEYFPENHFDYLHASQCLEHMNDPRCAILEWIRVVKPGGHLIITVPDVGSYERFRYPSVYNPDHRASFSTIYTGSAYPIHIYLPQFCEEIANITETIFCRYVEENYNWKNWQIDQTWNLNQGCELWNEIVWRKK